MASSSLLTYLFRLIHALSSLKHDLSRLYLAPPRPLPRIFSLDLLVQGGLEYEISTFSEPIPPAPRSASGECERGLRAGTEHSTRDGARSPAAGHAGHRRARSDPGPRPPGRGGGGVARSSTGARHRELSRRGRRLQRPTDNAAPSVLRRRPSRRSLYASETRHCASSSGSTNGALSSLTRCESITLTPSASMAPSSSSWGRTA
jgi:hypothetical protein